MPVLRLFAKTVSVIVCCALPICPPKCRVCWFISLVLVVTLTAAVLLGHSSSTYPSHASCRVAWTFGAECDTVLQHIVDQMHAWSGPDSCAGGGQRCLYNVLDSNSTYMRGIHTTPLLGYVDDISMQFVDTEAPASNSSVCTVVGFSRSRVWYAYLDWGTNYCNMKNLVVGSGLGVNDTHYSQASNNSVCTQYSSANCGKY